MFDERGNIILYSIGTAFFQLRFSTFECLLSSFNVLNFAQRVLQLVGQSGRPSVFFWGQAETKTANDFSASFISYKDQQKNMRLGNR